MEDVNGCGGVVLQETFYILSKKNTTYSVRLTEKGLSLVKESNGNTKTETITLDDIIGCRCLRSKRKSGGSCACRPNGKKDMKVVEENTFEADEKDISAYLYIYAYVLKKPKVGAAKRERMTLTLRFRSFDKFEDNMREAEKWRTALKCLMKDAPIPRFILNCDGMSSSPLGGGWSDIQDERRILVLVNPKSGPGRARDIFQQKVAPLLADAEIGYDLHISKHANYVREYVRSRDLSQWRAVVAVGGDGIIFEVINGLFERPDWQGIVENLPIGVVPCGSGNGLAKSIAALYDETYDQNPLLFSTLNIIKGSPIPMDLVRVETKSKIMFSFLSIGWGLISDIDIESERLRAIGGQRFTLWSIARLIGLRTYRGKLSYLLHPDYKNLNGRVTPKKGMTRSTSHVVDAGAGAGVRGTGSRAVRNGLHLSQSVLSDLDAENENCDLNLETATGKMGEDLSPTEEVRPRLDSFYSVTSRRSTYFSVAGSSYQSVVDTESNPSAPPRVFGPPSQLPALTQPVPSNWTVRESEFVMVHSATTTHLAKDCLFAPDSKMNDGIIWLLVIEAGITRTQLLQFLLGLSSGTHLNCAHVEVLPVTAFRLEPETPGSYVTVDGEVVEYGPIQAEVMPGLARVLAR